MVKGTVVIQQERCKGCGLCVAFCPQHVLTIDNDTLNAKGYHPAALTAEGCSGCSICSWVCPDTCFTVYREAPPARPIVDSMLAQKGSWS